MEIKWNDPKEAFEKKKQELIKVYLNLYDKAYHPAILSMFQNLKLAYYGKEALLRSTLAQINLIASMDTYVFFRMREKDYPGASEECLEILKGNQKDYSNPTISILSQQLFEGPFFFVHFSKEETKQLLEDVIASYPPLVLEVERGVLDLDVLSELQDIGAIHFRENPLHYVREEYDEEAKNKESKAFRMRSQLWKKEHPTLEMPSLENETYQRMLVKLRKLEPVVSKEEQLLKEQVIPYLKWWFSYHLCNIYHVLNAERQLCQSVYYSLEEEDRQIITQNPNFSPRRLKSFSVLAEANATYQLQDDLCKWKSAKSNDAYQRIKRIYDEQKIALSFLSPMEMEDCKRIYQAYKSDLNRMIGFSYQDVLFLNLDRNDSIDDNFDLMVRVNLERKTFCGNIYKWGLLGEQKSEELAYLDLVSNFYISGKVREQRNQAKLRIWDQGVVLPSQMVSCKRFEQLLEVLPLSDFMEARIAPNLDPLLKHGITMEELKHLGHLVMGKDEASGIELTQKIEELKEKQKRK